MNEKKRVVITGMGILAPGAIGKEAFWRLLSEGHSGIAPFEAYDISAFRMHAAGEIKEFDPKEYIEQRKAIKIMARDIQLAVAAAKLVMEDSGLLENRPDPTRFGISLGAGLINTSIDELRPVIQDSIDEQGNISLQKFGAQGIQALFPLWLLKYLPNMLACHVSIIYDAQGPSNSLTTGCAASSQAIGEAFRVIERGDADVCLAGGADSLIDPLSWARFEMLGLLSKNGKTVRPFDANRDGVVLGEAAGILALESLEHAEKRGANIYAELVGYSSTANPSPVLKKIDSYSQRKAMELSLKDAGVSADQIDYVHAHGLGLKETDRLETQAIKEVFQDRLVPVSSAKGATGFIGAAAGAVGAIATVQALQNNLLPPTLNYENRDPECDLDCVPNQARKKRIEYAMVNAFGLVGQNASLVLKKFS